MLVFRSSYHCIGICVVVIYVRPAILNKCSFFDFLKYSPTVKLSLRDFFNYFIIYEANTQPVTTYTGDPPPPNNRYESAKTVLKNYNINFQSKLDDAQLWILCSIPKTETNSVQPFLPCSVYNVCLSIHNIICTIIPIFIRPDERGGVGDDSPRAPIFSPRPCHKCIHDTRTYVLVWII